MDVEAIIKRLGGLLPIGESFLPMSESEATALEALSGGRLPPAYRYLLTTYGAFVFKQEVYLPLSALPSTLRHLADGAVGLYAPAFYGASSSEYDETASVVWNFERHRLSVGDEYVPFGDNDGNDIYFVDTSFLTNGRVLLWQLGDTETYPIAADFDAFLMALVAE
jgi:hypothetical protein